MRLNKLERVCIAGFTFVWSAMVGMSAYALLHQRNLLHFYTGDAVFAWFMVLSWPVMIILLTFLWRSK